MKVIANNQKNKCDIGGCPNLSSYAICGNENNKKYDICLCSNCLNLLYNEIGKIIIPKTIKNKLNRNHSDKIFQSED